MHNIYLASTWENRYVLRPIARQLQQMGHTITSSWIWNDDGGEAAGEAIRDLDDIDRASLVIVWPDEQRAKSSGKFVEYGYAVAKDKLIYVVERSSCVFFSLVRPNIHYFLHWGQVFSRLESE